jgi:hypothetical protein
MIKTVKISVDENNRDLCRRSSGSRQQLDNEYHSQDLAESGGKSSVPSSSA